jgi:hypothetical protein
MAGGFFGGFAGGIGSAGSAIGKSVKMVVTLELMSEKSVVQNLQVKE